MVTNNKVKSESFEHWKTEWEEAKTVLENLPKCFCPFCNQKTSSCFLYEKVDDKLVFSSGDCLDFSCSKDECKSAKSTHDYITLRLPYLLETMKKQSEELNELKTTEGSEFVSHWKAQLETHLVTVKHLEETIEDKPFFLKVHKVKKLEFDKVYEYIFSVWIPKTLPFINAEKRWIVNRIWWKYNALLWGIAIATGLISIALSLVVLF